jgi:hypothetical protein
MLLLSVYRIFLISLFMFVRPGIVSRQREEIFFILHSVQTGSGCTQPPLKWFPDVTS